MKDGDPSEAAPGGQGARLPDRRPPAPAPVPRPVASGALALTLGLAGGLVAMWLGLPLPMLIGSVVVVGALGIGNVRPLGLVPALPGPFRLFFVPVIGVAIGASFTPDILSELAGWWPSLLALAIFVPGVHMAGYWLIRATSDLDRPTAFFGSVPGGLVEAVVLGEENGADGAMLTMLQLLRVILTILVLPLAFSITEGHAVGSADGVTLGDGAPLSPLDWVVLGLAGALGGWLGRRVRLPAGIITGPIFASGAIHLLGWVEGAPPGWLIQATQLVIGTALGARFAGRSPRIFWIAARLAVVNVAMILAIALAAGLVFAPVVGERWEAVVLAYAPGGVAEMGLVALSLGASVIFVTAHHVLRIVLAVAFAGILWARVGPGRR